MPTREEWIRAYDDLMEKLRLPCKLQFFDGMKAPGRHEFDDSDRGPCYILINPDADFRVPEHLILHEAAHHRAIERYASYRHDRIWAKVLLGMYSETGIALPYTTGFKEFAAAAGIVYKVFDKDEHQQMAAVARNPGLVEGA